MTTGSKKSSVGDLFGFALVLLGLCGGVAQAAGIDAVEANRQIRALDLELEQAKSRRDLDTCNALIRRMAALDPDNPQPFYRVGDLMPLSQLEEAGALEMMEELSAEGPGLGYGKAYLLYRFGGRNKEPAKNAFRQVLEAYRTLEHGPGEAGSHLFLAVISRAGDPDAALSHIDSAIAIYSDLGDRAGHANALVQRGRIAAAVEDRDGAAADFLLASEIFREIGLPVGESRALRAAAREAEDAKDYDAALAYYDQAIEIRRSIRDDALLASSLKDKGIAIEKLNRRSEAADLFGEAAQRYQAVPDLDAAAQMKLWEGRANLNARRFPEAEAALRAAGALSKEAEILGWYLESFSMLGTALLEMGRYQAATEEFQEVIETGQKYDQPFYEGLGYLDLGIVAGLQGDQARSLELETKALELLQADSRRDQQARIRALHNLARAYFYIGRYDSALDHLEEGLALANVQNDEPDQARAWGAIGVVNTALGNLDEALAAHGESLRIRETLNDRSEIAWSQLNTSDTLWSLGQRDEARRLLDLALAGFRETDDVEGLTLALNVQGGYLRDAGKFTEALAVHSEAIDTAGKTGVEPALWVAHYGRGLAYEQQDKPTKALREYRSAIEIVETLRTRMVIDEFKMHFFANTVEIYDRAVTVQAAIEGAGSAPQTFLLVESARARSLADQLVDSRDGLRAGLSEDTAERERALTERVTSAVVRAGDAEGKRSRKEARRALREAEEELERLRLEIRRQSPAYSDAVYPEPVDLQTLQTSVLRDDETLLRYFVGEREAMLWVIDRNEAKVYRLPPPEEIRTKVQALRDEMTGSARRGPRGGGSRAVDALTAALLPVLPAKGRSVVIVPDGPLHYVPFEVLRHADRHLIEDHAVTMTPSATTLQVMRSIDRDGSGAGFAGIGDPVIPADTGLPPITDVLGELAALFVDQPVEILRGAEATRQRVLNLDYSSYRYVHFATHGLLDPEDPANYGLLLSPAKKGGATGILHVADVAGLGLNAELVVLAACRSGAGELLRGEGLVGMTRAFLFAGSRALLVSLWNVDDRATADFMKEFYGRVAAGGSPSGALRQTKLAFLASDRPLRRRSAVWAPFVLVGDPAAVDDAAEIAETVNPKAPSATRSVEGGR